MRTSHDCDFLTETEINLNLDAIVPRHLHFAYNYTAISEVYLINVINDN
jgi:hypothetical protein